MMITNFYSQWHKMAYRNSGALRLLSPVLVPCSWCYGAAARLRRRFYTQSQGQQAVLPVPVVSVGNLTVGGVGKTPFTIFLAEYFRQQGFNPAVLLRGYGRRGKEPVILTPETFDAASVAQYGDEAAMACFSHGITVGIGQNRKEVAFALIQNGLCDLILLDDGFQHLKLSRSLDLVMLDATNPFGNRRCLPAGPLRETVDSLHQADAVIFNDTFHHDRIEKIEHPKIFHGALLWRSIRKFDLWLDKNASADHALLGYEGKEVNLFSGIGNPSRLERQATSFGMTVRRHFCYNDHHWFTLDELQETGHAGGNAPLLTTEKDAIRLLPIAQRIPKALRERILVVIAQWSMTHEYLFIEWLESKMGGNAMNAKPVKLD